MIAPITLVLQGLQAVELAAQRPQFCHVKGQGTIELCFTLIIAMKNCSRRKYCAISVGIENVQKVGTGSKTRSPLKVKPEIYLSNRQSHYSYPGLHAACRGTTLPNKLNINFDEA